MRDFLNKRPRKFFYWRKQTALSLLSAASVLGFTLLPDLLQPSPAQGAAAIRVSFGGLELSLSTASLEEFANTGIQSREIQYYAQFLTEAQLAQFRQFLQRRFQVNPAAIAQFTYSPLGEQALEQLSLVIRTESGLADIRALRSALILSAAEPQGISILGFIRNYPTRSIRIRGGQLFELSQEFVTVLDYRDAAVQAIAQEAQTEMGTTPFTPPALPNPRQRGTFRVTRRVLELNRDRRFLTGETVERRFRVLVFLPEGRSGPAPVVVISHGLGSSPEAFAYLGQHLASHGFVAVLPQHIGSDASRTEAVLMGVLGSPAAPVEFVDRPLDISFTLDTLERLATTDPAYRGRMNLQQVGVIGHSFGGYTALALAGAELNFRRLQESCSNQTPTVNVSPLLQCLASRLPPFNYPLRDSRIKAAIAISPLTSIVFGPEGMGQIQVPTMLISGSGDVIASAVLEQIHPFIWLQTPQKYLALMVPSGHTASDDTPESGSIFTGQLGTFLSGPDPAQSREYIEALSLGFMQTYLNNRPDYQAFLTPAYAQSISNNAVQLDIVRSLTPAQLEQAFGNPAPVPIVPTLPELPLPDPRSGSVLQEIARTGVLKAAVQQNSAPFNAIVNGQTSGFCTAWLTAFATQLQQQLNTPVRLQIVTETNLENRFAVIQTGVAQIECGPNNIRSDIQGVAFSSPFFLTGTHLLLPEATVPRLLQNLEGARVGVLDGTGNAQVVSQQFPGATPVLLDYRLGLAGGVQALTSGRVDAIADDGILLLNEARRQNLSLQNFSLVPQSPLACKAYGMLLPSNDPQWQATVNAFLNSPQARQVWEQSFAELYPYLLLNLDVCAARP